MKHEHYRMRQTARIIKTLFMINANPTLTRSQLAEHFDVNVITVQRDINLCREMGVKIKVNGRQGYEIVSGFKELLGDA